MRGRAGRGRAKRRRRQPTGADGSGVAREDDLLGLGDGGRDRGHLGVAEVQQRRTGTTQALPPL
ncbi:hypothetical protein WP39_02980 [Streptomyces sp. 604F]|nr:hypothetical protein [Streptomyces sp. 604F]